MCRRIWDIFGIYLGYFGILGCFSAISDTSSQLPWLNLNWTLVRMRTGIHSFWSGTKPGAHGLRHCPFGVQHYCECRHWHCMCLHRKVGDWDCPDWLDSVWNPCSLGVAVFRPPVLFLEVAGEAARWRWCEFRHALCGTGVYSCTSGIPLRLPQCLPSSTLGTRHHGQNLTRAEGLEKRCRKRGISEAFVTSRFIFWSWMRFNAQIRGFSAQSDDEIGSPDFRKPTCQPEFSELSFSHWLVD